jgi:hypothetical protein
MKQVVDNDCFSGADPCHSWPRHVAKFCKELRLITQRSVVQIPPATQGIIADLKRLASLVLWVACCPCRILQTCCNAIQTLLQLNSNNYKSVHFRIILHWRRIAVFRGVSRFLAVLIASKFDETRPCLFGIGFQYPAFRRA